MNELTHLIKTGRFKHTNHFIYKYEFFYEKTSK